MAAIFTDDIFKCILFNEKGLISTKISFKFIPKGPIDNIPALVQTVAWHRRGDKQLSQLMMAYFTDANVSLGLNGFCRTRW